VKQISKAFMIGKEEQIINEIEILKRISKGHPNIITLHDYFETANSLYLVMDYCTGGELFDRLCQQGSYYEEDARQIIKTILSSVEYLHRLNIVHRDIKVVVTDIA
jgi:serine/threonine protein kinase